MPSTHTPVFTSALKVDGVAVTLKLAAGSSSKYTFSIDLTGGKTSMKFALFHAATSLSLDCFITDSRDHANGGTDVRTTRVIKLPHGALPGLGI